MSSTAPTRTHVTVVTAAGRTEPVAVQAEAANSVRQLAALLPDRIFTWVRVLDGDAAIEPVNAAPSNLQVVTLPPLRDAEGTTRRLGPGAPRNRALAIAEPGWVLNLDADDRFRADEMAQHIRETEAVEVLWSAAYCDDIDPDGNVILVGSETAPVTAGLLQPGAMIDHLIQHDTLPWHCGSMVIDRDLLRASGGWPAWRRAVDTAMAVSVTHAQPGLFNARTVFEYRRHPAQVTRTFADNWTTREERIALLTSHIPAASADA